MADAQSILAPQLDIPVFTYTIPEKSRMWKKDPKTVTIRQYTLGQELDATDEAPDGGAKFEYALLQRTVVALDGKPVDQGSNFLHDFSPPVRVHLRTCLNKANMPREGTTKDLLDSEVAGLGQ